MGRLSENRPRMDSATACLLQEYERRLREVSRLRAEASAGSRGSTRGSGRFAEILIRVARRFKYPGEFGATALQSPLISREESGRFDLTPFLYSMPEMPYWDPRRILLPVLNGFSFSGGERVRRELEVQFSGIIPRFTKVAGGGGTLAKSSAGTRNPAEQFVRWSREVGSDFLSSFSYHPVVPQLLRDASGSLRQGLLAARGHTDGSELADLPSVLTLFVGNASHRVHVSASDSRVLPRLMPMCEQLPIDARKVKLQLPGLRSGVRELASDWNAAGRVRQAIFSSAISLLGGIPGSHFKSLPVVTVVVATRRPDFLAQVLRMYERQTYKCKELVLVCHGFSRDIALQRAASAGIHAKVIEVGSHFNLGRCLNEGIRNANGQVWMKVDDDDLYGPNYVEDNVGLLVSTRADILARPLLVVHQDNRWLYDEDKVARTNVVVEESDPSGHMCGATLTGWVDPGRFCGFDEELGRGVDSELLQRSQRLGMRLVSVNLPGYACVRYLDPNHHTWSGWRASGKALKDSEVEEWLGMNNFHLEMSA